MNSIYGMKKKIRFEDQELLKSYDFQIKKYYTNVNQYSKRGHSKNKIFIDGLYGALFEIATYNFLYKELCISKNKKDYKPDFKIYKAKDKSFDYDLKHRYDDTYPSVSVKSVQEPYPYKSISKSWVVQKDPIDKGMLVDYDENLFVFGSINLNKKFAIIEFIGKIKHLHKYNLFKEPFRKEYSNQKTVIYKDDLEKISKRYNKKGIVKLFEKKG